MVPARLLPKLRSGAWPGAAAAVGRWLCPDPAGGQVPFVCVEVDLAGRRIVALKDPARAPGDADALLEEALASLERAQDVPEPVLDSSLAGAPARLLRWTGSLAAEVALSRERLRAAHRALGAEVLAVALPSDELALATDLSPESHATLAALESMARQRCARPAAGAGLTGRLFVVGDGLVLGPLDLARQHRPDPSQPAAAPLVARCEAEAHLYMDLRGVVAERRRELVPGARGVVTLFTARVEGESEPARFAFVVTDPGGALGAGGVPGASTILRPNELLTWADILSKRNPASPDGLDAAARRTVAQELTQAAVCLEELVKLIPPGARAVPESAFHGEAARRVYAREPGRFDGARLEAVAQTYRRIAARFGA